MSIESSSSLSNLDLKRLLDQVETQKLGRTVIKQRVKVDALKKLGEKTGVQGFGVQGSGTALPGLSDKKPSLLSRIFDVIQRPVHAVTSYLSEGKKQEQKGYEQGKNVLSRLFDYLSPDPEQLKAAGKGLWGTEKKSVSDLLKQAGYKNKFALGAGGLIGDIVLDPTTYLTFGSAAAAKLGARGASAKLIEKGLKAEKSIEALKWADDAATVTRAAGVKAGRSAKSISKEVNAAKVEAKKSYANQVMQEWKKAQEGSDVTKFQMRFMGKPIVQSELLGRAKTAVGAQIALRPSVQHFRKLFSTKYGVPEDVKFVKDMVKGQTYLDIKNTATTINRVFKGTSEAEWISISHAVEKGDAAIAALPNEQLREAAKFMKETGENWALIEETAGVLKPGQKLPNYVHHKITGKDADKLKINVISKKTMGGENPHFAKKRKYATIDDVKQAIKSGKLNAEIEERAPHILYHRLLKHAEIVNRTSFLDEAVNRFGVRLGGRNAKRMGKVARNSGLLVKPKSPFLPKDVLFDPEIASALTKVDQVFLNDKSVHHFLKMFDKVQNAWKFAVTVPNPGFHVRNLLGDTWNNFMDGVVNPDMYKKGARLAASMEGESMPRLVASRLGKIVDRSGVKVKVGNTVQSGDQVVLKYRELGLASGFVRSEYGQLPVGAKGILHKVTQAGRGVSQVREDMARITHFMDAWKKEARRATTKQAIDEAAERAARRVQKWNLDYNDLTPFEQKVMRRVVPFYTWVRKNIPLQLEALATKPGRVSVLPKGLNALQTAMGMPPETDPNDPLAELQSFVPKWLQELAGVQIGLTGAGTPRMFAPSLPIQDISRLLENTQGGIPGNILSVLTPGLRMPTEIALGKQAFNQQSVDTSAPGLLKYILQQTPQTRGLSRIGEPESNILSTIKNTLGLSPSRLAGVYDVTPGQQRGELRRLQDPLQRTIHDILERYKQQA